MTKNVSIMTGSGNNADSVNQAVSKKIKQYRKLKRLSIDELSLRADVSKGMLVKIENCKANPSIALLCRLATAMGVSVADFINVNSGPVVNIIANADIPNLWKGELSGKARLLAGSSGPDMVELWLWELAPGEKFCSPGHSPETIELFHVQAGTLTLGVKDSIFQVNEGCSATAKTDVYHFYENKGNNTLIFIMTVNEKAI
ncbi:TPA: helix-turn-helix domain-containing protein [Morganella morganii]